MMKVAHASYGEATLSHGTPRGWVLGCAAVLCLLPFAPTARANTSVFIDSRTCSTGWPNYCSNLSNFGLLTGDTTDLLTINSSTAGWTFNGGIGVGASSELSSTGSRNVANSIVDFADAVSSTTSNCGTIGSPPNFCTNGGSWDGGQTPTRDQTLVNNAETSLDNIIAKLATYTTGNGTITSLPTTGSLNVQQGITAGSVKVYRNSTAYTQSGALTFGCGGTACNAKDLVIVYLSGGTSTFNYNINLNDGLTSDQVLFYLPGNNLAITPTAGATTVKGSFFLSNGTVTVGGTAGNSNPVTLNGRIYDNNGNITFNNKGGSESDDGYIAGPAPEPATSALMIAGLGVMIWAAKRKVSTR
jgi:hypothetical protein